MEATGKREKLIVFAMAGILILTALVSLALILSGGKKSGRTAVIISDGKEAGRYAMDSIEGEKEIRIQSEGSSHYNIILISAEGVCVKESDCKGQDCVMMGTISHSGETIACLPNRLIITIISDDTESGYDAVTY